MSDENNTGKIAQENNTVPAEFLGEDAVSEFENSNNSFAEGRSFNSFDGKKVLLVEDNEMNRDIATDILEDAGLDVETAEDGELAMKKIIDRGMNYYDFILMDIQMPVMDGYETTKALRALRDGDKLKIIALSANAYEEDVQKSLECGMNAHVAKPINFDELFDTMRDLRTE